MKASELEGGLLDYWVARVENKELARFEHGGCWVLAATGGLAPYEPSVEWVLGGPLIDKYRMYVDGGNPHDRGWAAATGPSNMAEHACGPTPLVAICRAVVRSVYGDEVPDEAPEMQ